jgi:hypothetical protein
VNKVGRAWGEGITEKAVWHIVKESAKTVGIAKLAPHDLRRTCARLCHASGGELEQIQFLLGHVSVQTTERYLAVSNGSVRRLMIASGSSPAPKGARRFRKDCRSTVHDGKVADHAPAFSSLKHNTAVRQWARITVPEVRPPGSAGHIR